jgi:hypothetical protein
MIRIIFQIISLYHYQYNNIDRIINETEEEEEEETKIKFQIEFNRIESN